MSSDNLQKPGNTQQPENADSAVRRIREYELQQKIGQGGMGSVFLASHTMLERQVAVKLLPPERMDDEMYVSRFRREMKAVGRLTHPNIVQAFDAGEQDGQHFLVMEFVDGIDIGDLQKKLGQLPIADACDIIRQAAVGLQHAHESGMVHRDIKPSNLLLGRDGTVKVLDLGLALLNEGDAVADGNLTSTGQIMGTLDFMAPEQADDTHTVDIRADIYSLGCSLYALLAGHPPFSGPEFTSPVKKLAAHLQKTAESLNQLREDVPPEVVAIVDRMMQKNPDDRFTTPGEVADALSAFTAFTNLPALLESAESVSEQNVAIDPTEETHLNTPAMLTETRQMPPDVIIEAQQSDIDSAGRLSKAVTNIPDGSGEPFYGKPQRGGRGNTVRTALLLTGCLAVAIFFGVRFLMSNDDNTDTQSSHHSPSDERRERDIQQPNITTLEDNSAEKLTLWFDGDGDYVEAPTPIIDGRYPFTMEAWVTPTSATHNPVIGCLNADGGALLRIYDGHWAVVFRDEKWQSNHDTGTPVEVGKRTHVAMVYDKVEVRLYVNGKLTQAIRNTGEIVIPQNAPFRIGAAEQEGSVSVFFDGQIDGVRISKTAKYRTEFAPDQELQQQEDTVALYNFTAADDQRLANLASTQHAATIHNAKWLPLSEISDPKSQISNFKSEIPEPPPLEEWLKGREILTVAQDGSGQFKSIQEALDALKPGQVVEVLDEGPYGESIELFDPARDTGLISRVGTVVNGTKWIDIDQDPKFRECSHRVAGANGFRIAGIKFGATKRPNATVALINAVAPLVIEDSGFSWLEDNDVDDNSTRALGMTVSQYANGDVNPSVIRRCVVAGNTFVFIRNATWIARKNLFLGSVGHQTQDTVTSRVHCINNVFAENGRLIFGGDATNAKQTEIRRNTFANPESGAINFQNETWATNDDVNIVENLFWSGTGIDFWEVNLNGDRLPDGVQIERNLFHGTDHLKWNDVRINPADRRDVSLLSPDPHSRNWLRPSNNELNGPQSFAGALPPGPAPPEGDWFTRLLDRWRDSTNQLESEISNRESEIAEPPPLEEYLKGREILTVAQDGSGQFKSIHEALDAVKSGQVVEVLDNGPYMECLLVQDPPDDIGLITRCKTFIVANAPATPAKNTDRLHKHSFAQATGLRIHGFTFSASVGDSESKLLTDLLHVHGTKVVIEDCVFSWPMISNMPIGPAIRNVGRSGTIRRCIVSGQILVQSGAGGHRFIERCLVNSAASQPAMQLSGTFDSVTATYNVIDNPDGAGILVSNHSGGAPVTVILQHNTIRCKDDALAWTAGSTSENIQLTNNIFGGHRVMPKIGESRYWLSAGNVVPKTQPDISSRVIRQQIPELKLQVEFHSTDSTNRMYMYAPDAQVKLNAVDFAGALNPDTTDGENEWFAELKLRQFEVIDNGHEKHKESPKED